MAVYRRRADTPRVFSSHANDKLMSRFVSRRSTPRFFDPSYLAATRFRYQRSSVSAEPPTLGVRPANRFDHGLLVSIHPAGEDKNEELEG